MGVVTAGHASTLGSCSFAIDIGVYINETTLVLEDVITQAIYEYWLEHIVLPQC